MDVWSLPKDEVGKPVLRCLKCESDLGLRGLLRIWTLRIARCPDCDAEHSLELPLGAKGFIQGFVGVTYGLTVWAGNSLGWNFLQSTGAYLLGFLLGTATLIIPFALTGRLSVVLINETPESA